MDRGILEAHSRDKIASDASEVNDGDPTAILAHIIDHATKQSKVMRDDKRPKGAIYMLLDFHDFLDGVQVQRKLKEFADTVSVCTIVIVAPDFVCPSTLEKEVTLIDFPVPSYKEIRSSLRNLSKEISTQLPKAAKEAKENEEDLVKATSGLTLTEAENAYAMSVVTKNRFDIQLILNEKKQVIRKGGILEYRDPRFTLDDLGGLDTLKSWFKMRRLAFKEDARAFGLPVPKGILLIGIPGTGKSMSCDALANAYKMPLLRLDFGAIFGSHVGESEKNMRGALQTAEAIAPCIVGSSKLFVGSAYGAINISVQTIWDTYSHNLIENNGECQIDFDPPLQIMGYDLDNNQPQWAHMHALVRRKSLARLRITTDDGNTLEVTEDHKLLISCPGKNVWKKAKELKEGDSIITVNNSNIQAVVAEDNANDRENLCLREKVSD